MKFYAADNHYGSCTDIGFFNTRYVLAFRSKQARDEYVDNSDSMAAKAITRKNVSKHIVRTPKPFSGERYALTMTARQLVGRIDGCIGVVDVSHPDAPDYEGEL